jgi:4-diphosphocytidyl-2-C-methyl-D-erythritol kinase
MILFPGCKINLGLNVLSKRADGYHDIETCFYPVNWNDVLELVPADSFQLKLSGIELPASGENLCTRIYNLLNRKHKIPPVEVWLHKVIPHGAGLGGGSSDAAAMLLGLNELFELQLSQAEMEDIALHAGSDCPFFINPLPKIATGRGEKFESVNLSLAGKWIILLKPEAAVSTAEAYKNVTIRIPDYAIKNVLETTPILEWRQMLSNAFEPYAFKTIPRLLALKESLYDAGALYASMSGSGSAIFGIFERKPESFQIPENMLHWQGLLD